MVKREKMDSKLLKKAIFSIHSLTGTLLLIALVSAFALAFSLRYITSTHEKERLLRENQRQCAVQIQRLTDTSDYLTSQLWYYVVTQKSQYLLNYWKEIEDGRNRERAINVLTDNNITDNECFFANKAKKESDSLVNLEIHAMRLVAESTSMPESKMPHRVAAYSLPKDEKKLSSHDKVKRAAEYIFGYEYSVSKQRINNNIELLRRSVNLRKNIEASAAALDTRRAVLKTMMLCILILLQLLLMVVGYYLMVNRPFRHYTQVLSLMPSNDSLRLIPQGSSEMRHFAETFNELYGRLQATNKELREMSSVDYLTKLPNRASFEQFVHRAAAGSTAQICILIIDIYRFKLINNTFGRMTGDMVLQRFAALIGSIVPQDSAMTARLGGQEFVVALLNFEEKDCFDLAKKISLAIKIFNIKGLGTCTTDTYIGSNIGGVCLDTARDGAFPDLNKMLTEADLALSCAKDRGKNSCCCYSKSDPYFRNLSMQRENEVIFEKDMWNALANNEFVPYVQPKYDLNSKDIVGAEALVRWNHPTAGLLMPDTFIPFFEKNGFVCNIDFYMFEQSCKTIRDWLASGITPLSIAVNFSWRHLLNQNFAEVLTSIIKKYNVSAAYIEIEMTETSLTRNWQDSITVIEKLRCAGFSVAIDDFGCGYSSLSMLRDFPVDFLKIDKSFIRDNITHEKELPVVQSILNLCCALGIKAICEGIETQTQNDIMRNNGCPYGQGFFFSKPLPLDELNDFIKFHHVE